jgi:hypothetical protein
MTIAYFAFGYINPKFENLSAPNKYQTIIKERIYAIQEAQKRGDYKCCIVPPCTMCYENPNKWNYFQASECFCDKFIVRGEDPCPQCKGVGCSADEHK